MKMFKIKKLEQFYIKNTTHNGMQKFTYLFKS